MLSIFDLPESFEPPDTIKITGEPEYSVDLGALNQGEPYTLEVLGFDMSSLASGLGDGIKVYDLVYDNPSPQEDVKTFLLHYPLNFDMGGGSSISKDKFDDFNKPIAVPSISLAIPSISQKIEVSIPLSVPGVAGSQLSPAVSVPLPETSQTLTLSDDISATIKTGKLVVTVPDGVEFLHKINERDAYVDISWAGKSLGKPTKGSSSGGFTEWSYSLDGQSITTSTKITISGTIQLNKVISSLNISLQPSITCFESITIKPNVPNPSIAPVDVPQVAGVKAVIFSEISLSLAIAVTKPSGAALEGLDPTLNAPAIGFDKAKPSGNGSPMVFKTGSRTLYLDSAYAATQGKTAASQIAMAIDLGLNGSKPITLKNIAVSPNSSTDVSLEVQAIPNFVLSKAVVNPNELGLGDALNGKFPEGNGFDLSSMNSLGDSLSLDMSRVSFSDIMLHLYLDTADLPEDMDMKMILSAEYSGLTKYLTSQNGDTIDPNAKPFDPSGHGITAENKDLYKGKLPQPSLKVDMSEVFNARPSDLFLNYKMTLPAYITIALDEAAGFGALKADIVIAVPFALAFTPDPSDPPDFVKLNMLNDKLGFNDTSPDIFSRTSDSDPINDYIEFIENASITLDYNNTLGLDGVTFFIERMDGQKGSLSFPITGGNKEGEPQLSIDPAFLAYPFVPSLTIGLPIKDGKGKLALKQGADAGIAIKRIKVLINTNINHEIKL
jgi:hypothetical protein